MTLLDELIQAHAALRRDRHVPTRLIVGRQQAARQVVDAGIFPTAPHGFRLGEIERFYGLPVVVDPARHPTFLGIEDGGGNIRPIVELAR